MSAPTTINVNTPSTPITININANRQSSATPDSCDCGQSACARCGLSDSNSTAKSYSDPQGSNIPTSSAEPPESHTRHYEIPQNKKEHLYQEYENVNARYEDLEDAYDNFQHQKDAYEEAKKRYTNLGSSLNDMAYEQLALSNGAPQKHQGLQGQQGMQKKQAPGAFNPGNGQGMQIAPSMPQQQNQSPQEAMNQPLPGTGMPYYSVMPQQQQDNSNTSGLPPVYDPIQQGAGNSQGFGGIPTQAGLQQQAQQGSPPTKQDISTLRTMLMMTPETAQLAQGVSDQDLGMLLQSDPQMMEAVKQIGPMMESGQMPPGMVGGGAGEPQGSQGSSGGSQGPQGFEPSKDQQKPMDPSQALMMAQQDPAMMQQAMEMVNSLSPQERQQMLEKMSQDPQAQQILKQMGIEVPQQKQQSKGSPKRAQ